MHCLVTKNAVTKNFHSAKCSYYSDKIAESFNTKQLFSITDKLMARNNLTPLPTKHHLNKLPELFSNFFCNKVQTIGDRLDKHLPVTNQDSSYTHDNWFSGCPFNIFTPISKNSIWNIILQCAPKTCELDAIPPSLFFECLDAILPTLTDVVNHSLLTGEFPLIVKTAFVKRLLKKTSPDSKDLKNYRPVFNCSIMSKGLEKIVLSQILQT